MALPAHAQMEPLTLQQAVTLAIERAPQIEAGNALLDSAQTRVIGAGRLPDPQLILGVDNLPISGAEAWSLNRDAMTMRKVGVMQEFPNGAKRAAERERATAQVTVAHSQVQQVRLQVAQAVAGAWLESHTATLALSTLQALRPQLELQAQTLRTALASNQGSLGAALDARSAIVDLDERVIEATRAVRAANAGLTRWLGADADRPLAALPALRELPVSRAVLLESLHRHAPLQVFEAQQALARSEIDVARAQKRPDWSAELVYANRDAAFSDMVGLEFRVGLPWFARHRQAPAIRARQAELSQLDAQREEELRAHSTEVTTALAAWDAAAARLDLYEQQRLPLLRQRAQASLTELQSGRGDLASLLQSQRAEVEAQLGYVATLRELGQAWIFLRYQRSEELP